MLEVYAALAPCAPKAAVPWSKMESVTAQSKRREYEDFPMGSCSFFTLSSPLQYKLENSEILIITPHI